MTRRLPPLNGLRAFEAAARHLSFTRAAEELSVTQAAISHQVKALEQQLGVVLFRRLNRALRLSDAGQALFPPLRDALDQIAEATARLRARETAGTLTVSTLPSVAVKWLLPRMSRFIDAHPAIDLRVSAKETLVDFARDDIDVAIRFGHGHWSGVRADWLADEQLAPVCSPALAGALSTPADLAHATLLHEDMLPLPTFPNWADWLALAGVSGVDPVRGMRFSHTHLMLQAAVDGRGVALAPLVIASIDLAEGRLVEPFERRLPTGCAYYVVYPVAAADRPKVRAFRDWVMDEGRSTLAATAPPPADRRREGGGERA